MKERQKEIIENYVKSYNSFDVVGMVNDLSSHGVFENISNGKVGLRTEGLEDFILDNHINKFANNLN